MANWKHNFYSASNVILPGESEADFEKMVERLRTEFKPNGCAEEQVVLDIARLYLDKARVAETTHRRFSKIAASGDSVGRGSGAEIEYYEKTCNLEARIDARIDKAYQRLATLKEYKRLEAAQALKQLPASPPIAPELDSSEPDSAHSDPAKVEPGNPPGEAQPEGDTK